MTERQLAILVLAAGQGTRMKSRHPKVLHEIAGRSLLEHVIANGKTLAPSRMAVVVGPDMEGVVERAAPLPHVVQEDRLGTGHAVKIARPLFDDWLDNGEPFDLLVVYGDTPLLLPETLESMVALRSAADGGGDPTSLVGLAFEPKDPALYGRVLLDDRGQVTRVVEAREATPDQLAVGLCNAGLLLADGAKLFDWVARLRNDNAKGEFYLTDLYELAQADGVKSAVTLASEEEVMGIDHRAALAKAEAVLQKRLRARALDAGVTLVDPESVWFSWDTELARDVVVEPQVIFGPGVRVAEGAVIHGFSHLEGASVGPGVSVGPYARLRPGTELEAGSKVGNFVEVKNTRMGAGAKANHLTYLGDSKVGAKANIGAGTITCNYDGFNKSKTLIGEGAFIGSNSALVAPLSIGKEALVAAGSTVTEDVPDQALALGRQRQTNLAQGAEVIRAKAKARKAAETGAKTAPNDDKKD